MGNIFACWHLAIAITSVYNEGLNTKKDKYLTIPGPHRATPFCTRNGVFTDQFIFRSILPRILTIKEVLQISRQKGEIRKYYF